MYEITSEQMDDQSPSGCTQEFDCLYLRKPSPCRVIKSPVWPRMRRLGGGGFSDSDQASSLKQGYENTHRMALRRMYVDVVGFEVYSSL